MALAAASPAKVANMQRPTAARGATFRAKLRALLEKDGIRLEERPDWLEFCNTVAADLDQPPEVPVVMLAAQRR